MNGGPRSFESGSLHDRTRELIDRYLDGEATPEERAELEAVLARDPDAARSLEQTRAILERLQMPIHGPDVSGRVLAEVSGFRPIHRGRQWPTATLGVLAASVLLTLGVVLMGSPARTSGPSASDAPAASASKENPDSLDRTLDHHPAVSGARNRSRLALGADALEYEGGVSLDLPRLDPGNETLSYFGGSGGALELGNLFERGYPAGGTPPLPVRASSSTGARSWAPQTWRAALRVSAEVPIKPTGAAARAAIDRDLLGPHTGKPGD